MIKNIKKLASGFILKLFVGFLILSFAFFGISSFLLGGGNSWVAKVGGKQISYQKLQKVMGIESQSILKANKNNPKAAEYVASSQFAIDVLGKIINQAMVEKLGEKYGINGDRRLILQQVAKDPAFKKDGKFDRQYFKYFLAQNGIDEQDYIKFIQDEIVNAMVVNSISMTSFVDDGLARKMAILQNEKRIADVVTISSRNIKRVAAPKKSELEELYEKNKASFIIPEKRKISYIVFKKSDLLKNIRVNSSEVKSYYNNNKENYKQDEKRDFYHITFKEKNEAQKFLAKIEKSKNKSATFVTLGKKLGKKSLTILDVKKTDLLKDVANSAFSLKKNENSEVLESALGFHVFLLKKIRNDGYEKFTKVAPSIKKQLLKRKKEGELERKISQIDNLLLKSNSLKEVAQKFATKKSVKSFIIDRKTSVKNLNDFVKNAFLIKQNQTTSLFDSGDLFYALNVDEIKKSRAKTFPEVKNVLKKAYLKQAKNLAVKKLAQKISQEIRDNPKNLRKIAARYRLKLRTYQKFGRLAIVKFQGKEIPYESAFLKELFAIKTGQSTSPHQEKESEFKIAVLKKIKIARPNKKEIANYKAGLAKTYRDEFIEKFNEYMQDSYKIDINKKFLSSLESKK